MVAIRRARVAVVMGESKKKSSCIDGGRKDWVGMAALLEVVERETKVAKAKVGAKVVAPVEPTRRSARQANKRAAQAQAQHQEEEEVQATEPECVAAHVDDNAGMDVLAAEADWRLSAFAALLEVAADKVGGARRLSESSEESAGRLLLHTPPTPAHGDLGAEEGDFFESPPPFDNSLFEVAKVDSPRPSSFPRLLEALRIEEQRGPAVYGGSQEEKEEQEEQEEEEEEEEGSLCSMELDE